MNEAVSEKTTASDQFLENERERKEDYFCQSSEDELENLSYSILEHCSISGNKNRLGFNFEGGQPFYDTYKKNDTTSGTFKSFKTEAALQKSDKENLSTFILPLREQINYINLSLARFNCPELLKESTQDNCESTLQSFCQVINFLLWDKNIENSKLRETEAEKLNLLRKLEFAQSKSEALANENFKLLQKNNNLTTQLKLMESDLSQTDRSLKKEKANCEQLKKALETRERHHQVAIQRLENEIENLKDKLRRNFFTSSEAISNTHERLLENLSLDTQMVENVVKAQGFTLERLASDNKILTETIFEIFSELIKTFNLEDSNLEPENLTKTPWVSANYEYLRERLIYLVRTIKSKVNKLQRSTVQENLLLEEKNILETELTRYKQIEKDLRAIIINYIEGSEGSDCHPDRSIKISN